MNAHPSGYHKVLLDINLTTGEIKKIPIPQEDIEHFVGGRGLGMKILWDRLKKPGIDALSPENPLMFMPGPFSGFPIPSASRTVVVTKSPATSPDTSPYPHASTVSYSNIGGFLGPEIRFAGYDGIVISGKAPTPSYIVIEDDRVEIRDAKPFWGMKTDAFDKTLVKELNNKRFQTCYIGPAGENLVSYACILHTTARAAGRGVGAVMGSKNLKAIAVKGTGMPNVADLKAFNNSLSDVRGVFKGLTGGLLTGFWRESGTAAVLQMMSDDGLMAVKNYREGTFAEIEKINAKVAREKAWVRDFACYCCCLACKKSGAVKDGPYKTIVHDGPEYETGVMFGANLMISDFNGLMKAIYDGDDLGMDIISAGNVIGFLMEAHEKGYVTKADLDGIDLTWGNVDAVLLIIDKISRRDGIGDLAAQGVKAVSKQVGRNSEQFAIHVKGLELAAHNIHANPPRALCYATSNRGACHLSGDNIAHQNFVAAVDSLGLCLFASDHNKWMLPGISKRKIANLLTAITGIEWDADKFIEAGERVFNLEKMFNLREGFTREDDQLPDRFFAEPFTMGPEKGARLDRQEFTELMDKFYAERNWNPKTTRPTDEKLKQLNLEFTI
ncbi:MAG: aldehyde ferredoxin oxidoreductase family protein [Desulfobacteraceae bacterium]|nr:aldehyde ferredoxin oxidoreductase family protein [Desulfobacteraceae bacterium]MBC2756878.1 aldehyde ferredoxin oxidoreductase family protein [Desulfobacteraceae bacterium]